MAIGDNWLWEECLRKKYLHGNSCFECRWKKEDSLIWKGILSTQDLIRKGTCFKIDNEWNINFRTDLWVLGLDTKVPQVKEGPEADNLFKVAHLLSSDMSAWDERKLAILFELDDVKTILSLDIPIIKSEDKLYWVLSVDGKF